MYGSLPVQILEILSPYCLFPLIHLFVCAVICPLVFMCSVLKHYIPPPTYPHLTFLVTHAAHSDVPSFVPLATVCHFFTSGFHPCNQIRFGYTCIMSPVRPPWVCLHSSCLSLLGIDWVFIRACLCVCVCSIIKQTEKIHD